jgi:hypothetical protein
MNQDNPNRRLTYRDFLPLAYRRPLPGDLRTVKRPGDLEMTPKGVHRHG